MLIASGGITKGTGTYAHEYKIKINNAPSTGTPGGSAYVCAYSGENGTGDILWSWHIWVVSDTDPIQANVTTALGDNMMDRALGAIVSSNTAPEGNTEAVNRFGMHYQWGRKDPFTPRTVSEEVQIYNADGTAITKGANGIATEEKQSEFDYKEITTTINHLIQNPSTYYTKGDGTNLVPIASAGYNNTTKEGDWWNPTTKTLYDPCPNGYRVPENGTFGKVANTTNPSDIGWDWSGSSLTVGYTWNTSFFPTSGARGSTSGHFWGMSAYGYGWMSTPQGSAYGCHLYFYQSAVYPHYGDGRRASSMPVRCIRD